MAPKKKKPELVVDRDEKRETEEPVVEAVETEEPVVEAVETEEPVVEAVETEEPVVEAVEAEEPVVEAVEAEEPVVEAVEAEEPVVEATSVNWHHVKSELYSANWDTTLHTSDIDNVLETARLGGSKAVSRLFWLGYRESYAKLIKDLTGL
jgi:hypothetical protein